MLVIIALSISIFRYFAYPFGDIPDLGATIPAHLDLNLQSEIYHLAHNVPTTTPASLAQLTLSGGIYVNTFDLPSLLLYSYSCLPFIVCSVGLQFLLAFSAIPKISYLNVARKLGLLIITAPSTSYALISPKDEAFINCLALISFFAVIKLYLAIDSRAVKSMALQHGMYLFLMASFLYGASLFFKDNQIDIVLGFMGLSLVALFLNNAKLQPFSFVRFSLLKPTIGSVLTFLLLCLIAFLVSISSLFLPYIYKFFSGSAPQSVSFVSSSGLLVEEISSKYPTLFRPVFTLLSLSFGTASGYSIQILTRSAIIVAVVTPFWRFFNLRNCYLCQQLVILSLLCVLLALSLFPGYSNYKYWIFLSPLFFLPSALYAFKPLFILFIFVYFELFFKAILLQFQ